jgi:hypothetical protein
MMVDKQNMDEQRKVSNYVRVKTVAQHAPSSRDGQDGYPKRRAKRKRVTKGELKCKKMMRTENAR